jgi:hypothetical protein
MPQENAPDLLNPSTPKPVRSIEVHQQKGNFFRVVHANGVWCSVNAFRDIHMTFYSERHPIPTSIFFGLDEKGLITGEQIEKRQGKKDWFRELEVDVVLSLDVARQVYEGLGLYIKIAEDLAKSASPKTV